jgi:hypothetical protein
MEIKCNFVCYIVLCIELLHVLDPSPTDWVKKNCGLAVAARGTRFEKHKAGVMILDVINVLCIWRVDGTLDTGYHW